NGIHVAKLAGLPQELVTCAESYISEEDWPSQAQIQVAATREDSQPQLKSVVKILQALNLDEISPRQAWTELDRLKRLAAEVKIHED
ncbi:MAG TPA: hypothetical protein DEA85_03540, partial [Firmicutes bacterium]|nr:hypothetical protein [Bacillota bacterium]